SACVRAWRRAWTRARCTSTPCATSSRSTRCWRRLPTRCSSARAGCAPRGWSRTRRPEASALACRGADLALLGAPLHHALEHQRHERHAREQRRGGEGGGGLVVVVELLDEQRQRQRLV